MSNAHIINRSVRCAFAGLLLFGTPCLLSAQGRGRGQEKKEVKVESKGEVVRENKGDDKKVKQPKHVTVPQAVVVTRDVLVSNGYQIVRVVPAGTTQVIYYRRGNMGRGRGLGPVVKAYVVPAGQIVQFQSVPQTLLSTILARLGMS